MNSVLKMMDLLLQMMNFVFKMMNFALKLMNFASQMMITDEWEPLHVERGFAPSDSVVTCISLTSQQLIMDQTSRTAKQLAGTFSASLATNFSKRAAGLSDALLVVCPEHYDTFRCDEWTHYSTVKFMV